MIRTVSLSDIRSLALYTQQWYMSYRFCRLLTVSKTSAKLLMMDAETVRNM